MDSYLIVAVVRLIKCCAARVMEEDMIEGESIPKHSSGI